MSKSPKDDQYSEEETKRRAEEALKGAFKTPAPKASKKKKDASEFRASIFIDCFILTRRLCERA